MAHCWLQWVQKLQSDIFTLLSSVGSSRRATRASGAWAHGAVVRRAESARRLGSPSHRGSVSSNTITLLSDCLDSDVTFTARSQVQWRDWILCLQSVGPPFSLQISIIAFLRIVRLRLIENHALPASSVFSEASINQCFPRKPLINRASVDDSQVLNTTRLRNAIPTSRLRRRENLVLSRAGLSLQEICIEVLCDIRVRGNGTGILQSFHHCHIDFQSSLLCHSTPSSG
ncbi:hypothetical protein HDK90DRAFT_138509 [Phyllosticta capitalensis]|uniref:Uncharacterized protein n=1 Tax=Phyllosticta capitalensis TaxID=121624 RepID=A0ABR1YZ88_9PEZI